MRFYLDENLSPKIAEIARGRCGLDAVSAEEAGTRSWSDAAQLGRAAGEGRCLVTRDRGDFTSITLAAFDVGAPHAGVLVVQRSLPSKRFIAIAAALCAYAERFPGGLPPYTIAYLHPA